MPRPCGIEEIKKRLYGLYQRHWGWFVQNLPTSEGLSNPLFLSVTRGYLESKTRLMVIGQQTKGWGWGESSGFGEDLGAGPVSRLMQLYDGFALGKNYTRSPFWQAAREIYQLLNPGGPELGFLWSNLVKIDQYGRRPATEFEGAVGSLGLLPEEIGITKPDVIVFFTGPYYDGRLEVTFQGLEFIPNTPAPLTQVSHPALPRHTFRTYHPNYLRLSRQWKVISMIAENVGLL